MRGFRWTPETTRQAFLLGAILLIGVLFGVARPTFLSFGNFLNIGLQTAIIAVMAFAMTGLIIARGIDLSVGSTVAFAGIVGAEVLRAGWSPFVGLAVIVLVAVAIGALNGFLVTVIGINPFIATLGTLSLARGAALTLSEASSIDVTQAPVLWLGSARIGTIPVSLIATLVLLVLGWFLLNRTVFGRRIYAIGGNAEAARASAIPVRRTLFAAYLLVGVATGLGSIMTVGRLGSAQPLAGEGLELAVITAVIVGGTKLSGGEGSIVGTFLGAMLVGVISTGLSFLGVRQEITYIITGLLILIAVLSNQLGELRPAAAVDRLRDRLGRAERQQ